VLNTKTMKKNIFIIIIAFFTTIVLYAQPGQQAVNNLLTQYQQNVNLSNGQSFSDERDKKFIGLFTSSTAMVSALGIKTAGNKQIFVNRFVNLIKGTFDEESDISLVLTKIKKKKPSKLSASKYLYKITASQSFTGFKKDGSDFTSVETIMLVIEYNVNTNTAFIVSTEVIDNKSGLYIDLHVLAGMTSITGDLASGVSGSLESSSKFGFGFGLGVDYMITENFGVTTGLTMMSYSSSFTLSNFEQDAYRTVDKDGDEYDLLATGTNVVNDVKLKYIEIPIGVVMRFGGFIARLGVKYGISGSSTSTFTDGSITATGYYPKYSTLLYDIPEYGFDTYSLSGSEGVVNPKSAFNMFIQAGYSIPLSQKISLSFTGFYQTSLSSIHEAGSNNIASGNEQYTSVLNLMDSSKISAFGVEVGFGIKLF